MRHSYVTADGRLIVVGRDNPCIAAFGRGPEGKRCKTCAHLYAHRLGNTYWKCEKRTMTHGPGSDHRVRWAACGKYEER